MVDRKTSRDNNKLAHYAGGHKGVSHWLKKAQNPFGPKSLLRKRCQRGSRSKTGCCFLPFCKQNRESHMSTGKSLPISARRCGARQVDIPSRASAPGLQRGFA